MLQPEARNPRRDWLGVLARAPAPVLEAALASIGTLPAYKRLRPPEAGLVMARGRIGGDGNPFNLGEVAVARCAIAMDGGILGVGYALGRDLRKAEVIAVLDGLLQQPSWHGRVASEVLEPETARQTQSRTERAAKVAATRVNFFTLVRGE